MKFIGLLLLITLYTGYRAEDADELCCQILVHITSYIGSIKTDSLVNTEVTNY